jgi:hypothetical protein
MPLSHTLNLTLTPFSSVQSTLYWSATTSQIATFALTLVTSSGNVGLAFKNNGSSYYLLPVRSAW